MPCRQRIEMFKIFNHCCIQWSLPASYLCLYVNLFNKINSLSVKSEFYHLVSLVMLENLLNKNRYISNTNLLYKIAQDALLEKHVIKRGNQILVYEISSLKQKGKFIKSLEINKLPITLKTKQYIKYAKVPKRSEIIKDFLS